MYMRIKRPTLRTLKRLAVLVVATATALWVVLAFFNPYSAPKPPAMRMILLMALVWLSYLIFLRRQWIPMLYVVSVLTLVPIGLYLLMTPGTFQAIGWLSIALILITAAIHAEVRAQRSL